MTILEGEKPITISKDTILDNVYKYYVSVLQIQN